MADPRFIQTDYPFAHTRLTHTGQRSSSPRARAIIDPSAGNPQSGVPAAPQIPHPYWPKPQPYGGRRR